MRNTTQTKRAYIVCYGKTLEEEAKELFVGDNVKIHTSHALALSYLPSNLKESVLARTNMILNTSAVLNYSGFKGHINAQMFVKIPTGTIAKCIKIISKQFIETASEKVSEIHLNKEFFTALKSLEKQNKLDEKNKVAFKELMLECASKLTTEMMDLNSSCPTTHDGYLKSWQLSNPVLDYDYILFDEAQDSNPVLLHIILSQQCQKILVADSYQNIFQFRGSLNVLKMISFDKYPLTHSFRYGQDLADLASKVLNHIDNKIAITGRGYDTQIIKGSECEHSEPFLFIAYTNFSTYEVLTDCYQSDVPAKILGDTKVQNAQSVLSSLISFSRHGLATHNDHKKYKSFSELLERNNKGGELSKLAEMVNSNIEYAEDLLKAFEWSKSFSNDQVVVTLITAHLSKGLEADNVFIADDFLFCH
ncbi:UvrD-helicase domain-containing protein [Psychromonas sp. KJ10-2]|uniref:UvrD-helicase domain-containing protein n=1 Tax=Psychromonas sp. KJ10-2 TaxID=3391822 RepID=UPI0039B69BDB